MEQRPLASELTTSAAPGRIRRRAAAGLLAVAMTFSGLVVAQPAGAQPAAAAVSVVDDASLAGAPVDGAAQFGRGGVCATLNFVARLFVNFPFVLRIIASIQARFGCVSPG